MCFLHVNFMRYFFMCFKFWSLSDLKFDLLKKRDFFGFQLDTPRTINTIKFLVILQILKQKNNSYLKNVFSFAGITFEKLFIVSVVELSFNCIKVFLLKNFQTFPLAVDFTLPLFFMIKIHICSTLWEKVLFIQLEGVYFYIILFSFAKVKNA